MFRDWWTAEGRTCVEGYLDDKGDWNQEAIDAAVVVMGGLLEENVLDA